MSISTNEAAGRRSRFDALLPALCFLLCLLSVMAAIAFPKGPRVVVVAAPWSPNGEVLAIVTRSGGSLVAATDRPWVVVAQGDADDFPNRLLSNGAILVLDGVAAILCSKEEARA